MLMRNVDFEFWTEQCTSGLSSGEGLIQKVSDRKYEDKEGNRQTEVAEKRVYVVEPEFSKVLSHCRREGNILSPRFSARHSTAATFWRPDSQSVVGERGTYDHRAYRAGRVGARFSDIDMANGFGNRFLWFYSKSDKMLPDARRSPARSSRSLPSDSAPCCHSQKQRRIEKDEEATKIWCQVYPYLRTDKPGLQGRCSLAVRLSSYGWR